MVGRSAFAVWLVLAAMNQPLPAQAPAAWSLGTRPSLEIGTVEGDSFYELNRVRHVRRLSDGRVVLTNGRFEVRMFDARGRFVRAYARRGEGPGEFQMLMTLEVLRGDTILLHGGSYDRVAVLDGNFRLLRSYSIRTRGPAVGGGRTDEIAPLDDGRSIRITTQRPAGFEPGRHRYSVVLLSRAGALVDTLGHFDGASNASRVGGAWMPLKFGPQVQFAARGQRIAMGPTDQNQIQVTSPEGKLLHAVRLSGTHVRVTDDHVRAEHRAFVKQVEQSRTSPPPPPLRLDAPRAEYFPLYDYLLFDHANNLWVRRYALPGASTQRWDVFDPNGKQIAVLEQPANYRISEVASDYVLGVWTGELDVQAVRMYKLNKPQR
jgi:hypothetical protein